MDGYLDDSLSVICELPLLPHDLGIGRAGKSVTADWHVLDARSIWIKEFASALSCLVPTVAWHPSIRNFGHWQSWERIEAIAEPPLRVTHFPLQRGYARPLIGKLMPFERTLLARLKRRSDDPAASVLICTTPFYAPIAEQWPGPVVYYLTDLTKSYDTCDAGQVVALDKRLCHTAALVCPNSRRIADYLLAEAECDRRKILVVPNATRSANIPDRPVDRPGQLPDAIAHLKRPVAGVIGNLAGNMDWVLLKQVMTQTRNISWVFVGPTTMAIEDCSQSEARQWAVENSTFTGPKAYGQLQDYARSFDVALLPYHKHEPTYSGSSTRFYEHLAAGRPMIGTRGFAELLEKEPLITLVDTAAELSRTLEQLQEKGFEDGQERSRWLASQTATWGNRAQTILAAYTKSDSHVRSSG